ncbi:hypothetical protein NDR87_07895 [Nocardia sp. CDC159]|uniref:Uncharacterized protein n=1 Tax=Nocardia pulmonis TaxID=2951408 RepID=A0A9X2E4C6_9NOCA|nr:MULTISPECIES: hypothetical protein [Nocardia]MCM6773391.1 hypothetical protein [Nocardia pulmonis]MCM6786278.1 hypothetical protein [Nocardia sp. CDC159]
MCRWARLFVFDGGVLELFDYGDEPDEDSGPGVYLELFVPSGSVSRCLPVGPEEQDDEDEVAAS